jgi:hypothetical protein
MAPPTVGSGGTGSLELVAIGTLAARAVGEAFLQLSATATGYSFLRDITVTASVDPPPYWASVNDASYRAAVKVNPRQGNVELSARSSSLSPSPREAVLAP